MNTDTIADMLTRIRNAHIRGLKKVELPYSSKKEDILKVMKKYEFIKDYSVFKEKGTVKKGLSIELKYDEHDTPGITKIERVSKSGYRVYEKAKEIKPVLNGRGIYILSTSRGVMSSDDAKKQHLGGEVLCRIY